MQVKDFFAGLLFMGLAGYFTYALIESMPLLFKEQTKLQQYIVAFSKVAIIIFLFNLSLKLIKKFFTPQRNESSAK